MVQLLRPHLRGKELQGEPLVEESQNVSRRRQVHRRRPQLHPVQLHAHGKKGGDATENGAHSVVMQEGGGEAGQQGRLLRMTGRQAQRHLAAQVLHNIRRGGGGGGGVRGRNVLDGGKNPLADLQVVEGTVGQVLQTVQDVSNLAEKMEKKKRSKADTGDRGCRIGEKKKVRPHAKNEEKRHNKEIR